MKPFSKMKSIVFSLFLFLSIPVFASNPCKQQESDSVKNLSFDVNADIVSRYIWRGIPANLNPNIQPYATLNFKNFSFGAWGSYGLSTEYAEVDLNLSYTLSSVTFSINDYFNEDESEFPTSNYLRFVDSDSLATGHALEGAFQFNGPDNLPLTFTAATFFYGNDKNSEDENYFSTYLELGYEHTIGETTLSYFVGGTLWEGYYAEKAALVNVGLTASKELKISESASIPLSASLIVNPNSKHIYFVFGITL